MCYTELVLRGGKERGHDAIKSREVIAHDYVNPADSPAYESAQEGLPTVQVLPIPNFVVQDELIPF